MIIRITRVIFVADEGAKSILILGVLLKQSTRALILRILAFEVFNNLNVLKVGENFLEEGSAS